MELRLFCAAAMSVALAWAFSTANAESGLAGTYRASPQRIEARVSTWGVDCGMRPESQVLEPQGSVEVRQQGAHLVLRFADRTVRTDGCWSPNPAVKLLTATAVDNQFRAECRTQPGDAKREVGRYSVTANAGTLELVEENEYDWQLNESHCLAKVRITQTLVDTRKATLPPTASPPVVAEAGVPTEKAACVPGPPARIRLRPSDARIAPDGRVCFTVKAVDAAGCPSEVPAEALSLRLDKPSGAEGTLSGTCFKAAASAARAEGVFKVVAHAFDLRAEASVSVTPVDLSDITARRGPSNSGSLGQGAAGPEGALESGVRAVASGSHGLLWLGLSIAGLAGVLSLVAIVALRVVRQQANAASKQTPTPWEPPSPLPTSASLSAPPPKAAGPAEVPPETGPQRVCPKCRRGYPPGTARCATDSEALLDYADFLKRAKDSDPAPGACPKCSGQLSAGSMFCGLCGHRL